MVRIDNAAALPPAEISPESGLSVFRACHSRFTAFRRVDLAVVATAVACAMLGAPAARAQLAVPDFYQHQFSQIKNGGGGDDGPARWEADGGWCYETAIVDALYPWKVQAPPYAGLFSNDLKTSGKWLPAMGQAVVDVGMTGSTNNYLESKGFGISAALAGQPALLSMGYTVDKTNGNVSVNLAGGRTEIVKNTATNAAYNAFDLYSDQMTAGRSSVVLVNQTPASQGNGLWWVEFHGVAGVGFDKGTKTITFADPDSNKGNNAANAGWTKEQVLANKYTAADATKDVPLVGNTNGAGGNYTAADLYGSIKLADDKFTVASSTAANGEAPATGRYTGVRLGKMEMISPVNAFIRETINLINKFKTTVRLLGDLGASVDEIQLFPNAQLADSDFSFDQDNWTESFASTDPFGYTRSYGGEAIKADPGTYLDLGEFGDTTLHTLTPFSDYDVFFHDATSDQWLVQSFGAVDFDILHQQAVPEPSSWVLLATGLSAGVLLGWLRRRSRLVPLCVV